ncbi:hypothetical protein [Lysobacter enzymogenes]|nr:hypothetical protein [Lysobacter enzymogenes]UZW62582.1 hypothetical protein BV903_009955 [Lysobacter enzymogenes]
MRSEFFCRDFGAIRTGLDLQAFSRADAPALLRAWIFCAKKFLPEL